MAQKVTKRAKASRPGRNSSAGSSTVGSRSRSRKGSAKSSKGTRSTKRSGATRSPKKVARRISMAARYVGSVAGSAVNGRAVGVARRAKDTGVVAAKKTKSLGAVGAAGAAGLAGVAGGIALARWNDSYSRTKAFARSRPARSMRKTLQGTRVTFRKRPSKLTVRGKVRR